jgi:hypothetical protein
MTEEEESRLGDEERDRGRDGLSDANGDGEGMGLANVEEREGEGEADRRLKDRFGDSGEEDWKPLPRSFREKEVQSEDEDAVVEKVDEEQAREEMAATVGEIKRL